MHFNEKNEENLKGNLTVRTTVRIRQPCRGNIESENRQEKSKSTE